MKILTQKKKFFNLAMARNTTVASLLLMATNPAIAGAGLGTFTAMVVKFSAFITGGFGVALLTLVIMGAGIMAFFNKLDITWVVRIVIGSVLIFGAASIATLLLT